MFSLYDSDKICYVYFFWEGICYVCLATAAAVADPTKHWRPANAGLLYSHSSVAVFHMSRSVLSCYSRLLRLYIRRDLQYSNRTYFKLRVEIPFKKSYEVSNIAVFSCSATFSVIIGYKLSGTNYWLIIVCYQLSVMNNLLWIIGFQLSFMNYCSWIIGYQLLITNNRLWIIGQQLSIIYYQLPVNNYWF